nr:MULTISPECIES: helix-turn-helix domain-containing protein [Mycobacteriaceae]
MELRARGWSVRAAAREVGVSRSSGTNWARGSRTPRQLMTISVEQARADQPVIPTMGATVENPPSAQK